MRFEISQTIQHRKLFIKILVDVVKILVGAVFFDNDFIKVFFCFKIFFFEMF